MASSGTANVPAIAFTSPTTNAGASVTYVALDRKLTFTVQTAKMKQEEQVVFTITNVFAAVTKRQQQWWKRNEEKSADGSKRRNNVIMMMTKQFSLTVYLGNFC